MEELRALVEHANSWGKTQTGDAHTQRYSTACRQGELVGTRECPRRAGAPGSCSRTATHPGCRQGTLRLEGEKAGRDRGRTLGQGEHMQLPQSHSDSGRDNSFPNSWLLFTGCQMSKVSLYLSPTQAAAALGPCPAGCLAVFSPVTQVIFWQLSRLQCLNDHEHISNELCRVWAPLFSACLLSGPFLSPPV